MEINNFIDSSSIHSNDFEADQSHISGKLRRLKIQEEILTTSYNKSAIKCDMSEIGYKECIEVRNYLYKIKNGYLEIKTLYQDIKTITKDRESLKNTDIDDVKKDILELEKKIVALKEFCRKEISVLKAAEKELLIQINENPEQNKVKTKCRMSIKPFSDVVPSPVRALINSPLKSIEVQRFQDFLKTTKRYGGWDEYNHNIFVQLWNKYYGDNLIETPDNKNTSYLKFQNEICMKIFGIRSEDVYSHTLWYNEYLCLKKCQEAALNKWKDNKRKIKCPLKREKAIVKNEISKLIKNDNSVIINRQTNKAKKSEADEFSWDLDASTCDDRSSDKSVGIEKTVLNSHLYNPTRQWTRRCQRNKIIETPNISNINSIQKLKTPNWRLDIKD